MLMTDYTITEDLLKNVRECEEISMSNIPKEHRETKLPVGVVCDLSYQQGQRDAYREVINLILAKDEQIMGLYDEMSRKMRGKKQ